VTYPVTVLNMEHVTAQCKDKQELLNHLSGTRGESGPRITTLILGARTDKDKRISPDEFIEQSTYRLISQFMRCKRYGMNALYRPEDIPEYFLQASDIIQNKLDKIEALKLKPKDK